MVKFSPGLLAAAIAIFALAAPSGTANVAIGFIALRRSFSI
jgi:hypothetical protein